jgi:cytochrome P450
MQDPLLVGPAETVFDLYSTQIDADPFPFYAKLRAQHPCYWSERNATWILSRYEDVSRAAQDWNTYSSIKGNTGNDGPAAPRPAALTRAGRIRPQEY